MIAQNRIRVLDAGQVGALDYLLVGLACACALWSGGMSMVNPSISQFGIAVGMTGVGCSYLVRRFFGRRSIVRFDWVFYALALVVAIWLNPALNALFPDGGFPRTVRLAGIQMWCLMLGAFFMWRDSTLLFQTVPALALFGLVGCYDTYQGVTGPFFLFLICVATLFARSHRREMMRQARASDFGAGLAVQLDADSDDREAFEALRKGAWRWMAGPEWALASAVAVAIISAALAPLLQESVQGIAGVVQIQTPPVRAQTGASVAQPSQEARVGQGPLALTQQPVFEARLDRLRYLRSATYDIYTGNAWRSSGRRFGADSVLESALTSMNQPRSYSFEIRPLTPGAAIPVPAEPTMLDFTGSARIRGDGTVEIGRSFGVPALRGQALEPTSPPERAMVPSRLPPSFDTMFDKTGLTDRVSRLAVEAVKGARSDLEKARRVQAAITSRVRYNLRAAAVPAQSNPVDHFLFESREGYCDLFASSMVLMARAVDLPARYVTGYLPEERNRDQAGRYVVVQADGHAWAEVFLQGHGWVVFDATEGAAEVPNAGRGDSNQDEPFWRAPWFAQVLNGLIILVPIGGVIFLVWQSRQARATMPNRQKLDGVYLRFERTVSQFAGHRRRSELTVQEWLESLEPSLGEGLDPSREMALKLEGAMYGRPEVTDEELAALESDLQEWKQRMKALAGSKR